MSHSAHLRTVVIPGVVRVIICILGLACRTTIFNTDVVRILAFTANSGVTDMVASFALSAINAFDLAVTNGRVVEVVAVVLL